MSNKPFLRLVATALLHPLSPDSSSRPRHVKLRPTRNGDLRKENNDVLSDDHASPSNLSSSLNSLSSPSSFSPSHRRSFAFGRRHSLLADDDSSSQTSDDNIATYVLAPALADILDGDCVNTKPNPYRRVLLACLRRGGSVDSNYGGSLQSAAAVCMDSAIVSMGRHSLRNVLEACGALPRLENKTKSLMDVLLVVEDESTTREGNNLKDEFEEEVTTIDGSANSRVKR